MLPDFDAAEKNPCKTKENKTTPHTRSSLLVTKKGLAMSRLQRRLTVHWPRLVFKRLYGAGIMGVH